MEKKPIVIIDAWNTIRGVPRLRQAMTGGLEAARQAVVRFAAAWLARRGDVGQFWLVFDGGAPAYDAEPAAGIRVIHSGADLKADDRIVQLVERHIRDHALVIVSDDREVIDRCRQLGADSQSTAEFFGIPEDTRRPAAARRGGRGKADAKNMLSPAEEKAINDELKKVWGIE
ncbi:MAG: NYN domain-containing protein [Verrucomicrobiota bacterium]|nr:NYN domain-containing protein [Verrucomicrobiota bacterium]